MKKPDSNAPDALLLITSQCPHCPAMIVHLTTLLKAGDIGRLEIVNINNHPDIAEDYKVKSVPWTRIGPFDLDGVRTLSELQQWCSKATSREGMADYFAELLRTGHLPEVEDMVRRNPQYLEDIVQLSAKHDTDMHVRIGIGALLEQLQGSGLAHNIVHDLGAILTNRDARIRCDAAHYLTLTESVEAIPYLEQCLNDPDEQVQEIASEGLDELQEKLLIR